MEKRRKIVTVGGGTGSFTLLSGLKRFPVDISAVVSMADDGGSTGVLRDELGVLPPGDVRQCLVALSESSSRLRELMNYRFDEGGLAGHSFGNLFLSALEKVSGSFTKGVEEAMDILKVKGEVIPVTEQDVSLSLRLADGSVLHGENEINQSRELQSCGIGKFGFSGKVRAYGKAVAKVKEADMIVIGPGNLYCSLLPNLIIKDFAEAIRSSKAEVVYVANLTNKAGHTLGWDVDEYVREIERYIGKGRVDAVVWNEERLHPALVRKYERSEGEGVVVGFDPERCPERKYRLVRANVVSHSAPEADRSDQVAHMRAFIRHDPERLARAVMRLFGPKRGAKAVRIPD